MSKLTSDQIALVEQYEDNTLEELYDLIGNLATEYGDASVRDVYVVGWPNVFERGQKLVKDVRDAICKSRNKLDRFLVAKREKLEPILWAGSIADIILSLGVTGGVPPLAIAVALGKLGDRSLSKLCK